MNGAPPPAPAPRARWLRRIAGYVIGLALAWGAIAFVAQPLEVDGVSMEPLLRAGDEVLVWKGARNFHEGEIVVARPSALAGRSLIKRIIAGPGRTIAFVDGERWLDGAPAPEPWLHAGEKDLASLAPLLLGADQYFLAGDNRGASMDSRDPEIGPLNRAEITGRALLRLWPPAGWGRLGFAPTAPQPPLLRPGKSGAA